MASGFLSCHIKPVDNQLETAGAASTVTEEEDSIRFRLLSLLLYNTSGLCFLLQMVGEPTSEKFLSVEED